MLHSRHSSRYVRDAFNIFDAVIVLAGVVELIIAPPSFFGESAGGAGAISAFRVFRVGRIFKLARSWKQLQNVLVVIGNTLAAAGYFAVLLFLFMFIFALMGRQFFANRFHFDATTGRAIPIGAPSYPESATTVVRAWTPRCLLCHGGRSRTRRTGPLV